VKFAEHVDRAIALLEANDSLRDADIVLLQEMDEPGVQAVAGALGFGYVYYPATRRGETHRDFGNAILSRWPMENDRKIILPHRARFNGSQRIAVAATVRIGARRVRVYSVHLATMIGNGPNARRDQLRTVLADADRYPVTIIGGDFNSETVPEIALAHDLAWPTRGLPRTNGLWTFDHVLLRGLAVPDTSDVGVVKDVQGASDHRPVWARLVFASAATAARTH
jgi:endonuclease/exonuclease/phosphatase family metal-dependent hydrolase